jgi:hypothetical protein
MSDFTLLIERIRGGDSRAGDELVSVVYGELKRLATLQLARESAAHTLQPTALVHEAWLRLGDMAVTPSLEMEKLTVFAGLSLSVAASVSASADDSSIGAALGGRAVEFAVGVKDDASSRASTVRGIGEMSKDRSAAPIESAM